MEISARVKSSSSNEIYIVTLKSSNNLISVNCTCKAGILKSICKHRLCLIQGDFSALLDKSESNSIKEFFNDFNKDRFSSLFLKHNEIERELQKLDLIRKKLKKEIGIKLSDGF